jgi:putative transposase
MEWTRILAYITGTVDQELLLRNEYLVAQNRILKEQLQGRLRLSDVGRERLGEVPKEGLRSRIFTIRMAFAGHTQAKTRRRYLRQKQSSRVAKRRVEGRGQ